MTHCFQTEIATEYGVNAAIILENIYYWIAKNKANGVHFHEGYYWTYNSVKAFGELFPYMGSKAIRNALKTLEENEVIIAGDFNKVPYDRTKWYAITEKGESLFPKGQMEITERANREAQNGEAIPDIKPYNKPNSKQERSKRKKTEFVPPTVEEVREYAKAKNALVDPDYFHEHYTLSEWTDKGGNPIQNWKQVFLNWERREQKNGNGKPVSSTAAESAEEKRARWGIHYDNE